MSGIVYMEAESTSAEFLRLSDALDQDLDNRVGTIIMRDKFADFNRPETMDYVLLAYDGERAIGCCGLRGYSETQSEIKRFFVEPEYRGQGIGDHMLQILIYEANRNQIEELILETGELLVEATSLYRKYGFQTIENYGHYVGIEESLCMGMSLLPEEIRYCTGCRLEEKDLRELFSSVGWMSANYAHRMVKAFAHAGTVISAWQNGRLVGLLEALDDGELNAYIHYLLVRPECQNQGVGSRLLALAKERYREYLYLIVISEERENVAFYEKCGFGGMRGAMAMKIL